MTASTITYDAIETPTTVCFVIEAEAPPARSARITVMPNRGVEIACGHWKVRFGNLHPRLMKSTLAKKVVLAVVCGERVTFRSAGPLKEAPWRLANFYWYLHIANEDRETLKDRPLPRAICRDQHAIALTSLATSDEGPPVALCSCTEGIMALPRGRRWLRLSKGLLIDQGFAMAYPDDIDETVEKGLSCTATPQLESERRWRPQLAMIVSDA